MKQKTFKIAILPLAMMMLAACSPSSTSTSTPASPATTSQESAIHYSETITYSYYAISGTAISYSFEVDGDGAAVTYTKAILKDSTGAVGATDDGCAAKKFTGLKGSTTYTFEADYTLAGKAKTFTSVVKTPAVFSPSLSIKNSVIGTTSLSGEIVVSDPDKIYHAESLKLYLDKTEVATSSDLTKFNFTGLTAATTYKVTLDYSFDRGDGNGVQEMEYLSPFTTKAA